MLPALESRRRNFQSSADLSNGLALVKELLNEDKKQHLQTYGYVLEKSIPSETDVPSDSILDKFSSTHYVK